MSLGLGPVSCLMTWSMYATWCQKLELSAEAVEEMGFWLDSLERQDIWPKPSAVQVVYSNVSATGYGGYMVKHRNLVANGQWSNEEAAQSSTWTWSEVRVI